MPSQEGGWFGDLARFAGLGTQLFVWVGFIGLVGYFADQWLNTDPWLLVVGTHLDLGQGMWEVVRSVDVLEGGKNDPS